MTREQAEAAALDTALIEVLTFSKAPQGDLLKEAAALYDRHHGNPAAMGLLYGSITTLQQRSALDLVQQQELNSLKERIAQEMGAESFFRGFASTGGQEHPETQKAPQNAK